LVHRCFDPDAEEKPESCDCRHRVSKAERDARVKAGELCIINGHAVRVVPAPIFKRPQQATTVDGGRGPRREGHIQRAYGFNAKDGSARERRRIEFFKPGAL